MTVTIKAKSYIEQVKTAQSQTPPGQRKIVPSAEEMALAGGVHLKTIYNFLARDDHRRIDIFVLNGIIKACRAYGHDTQLTDLLAYTED